MLLWHGTERDESQHPARRRWTGTDRRLTRSVVAASKEHKDRQSSNLDARKWHYPVRVTNSVNHGTDCEAPLCCRQPGPAFPRPGRIMSQLLYGCAPASHSRAANGGLVGTKVGQDVPQSAVRSVDAAVDDLELLAGTLLFEGLSTTELEVLRPAIRSRSFARDAYVFREGDPGSHLYVVVRGRVKIARFSVDGGEVVFALVGPGEVFGELALFAPDGERTADAQALEPTRCVAVNRDAVVSLLLGHPDVLFKMISWLTAYIRRKDATIAEAAFLDIPARVGLKLVELAQSKGNRVSGGVLIDVPLSQRTLAGMVGASRENVNRALNRFVALGFIRKSRGRITVLQPDQLRRRGLARM